MVFVAIGRYENETTINSGAKAILTGPDTLSNYETTTETETRRGLTLTGTYSGTGLSTEVFINPELAAGTGTGQLENAANITTRGDVLASAEVYNFGVLVTSTTGETDYNGVDVTVARSRRGRLQSQFTNDDIRFFQVNVSITQTNGAIAGMS